MLRRLPVLLFCVVAALTVWAGPVGAHAPVDVIADAPAVDLASTASWQAADPPPGAPWTAAVIVVAVAVAVSRRPRRALALAVVLILALFAFENGVHSVHHLNDHGAGASCAVASATVHVGGTPVDVGATEPLVLTSAERLVLDRRPSLEAGSLAAHQGRAPPSAA